MEEIRLESLIKEIHSSLEKAGLCFPGERVSISLASLQYIDNYLLKIIKAAYTVVTSHPFNDGNKRTALELIILSLSLQEYSNEVADIILKYAANSDTFDNFAVDFLTLYLESLGIDNPLELIPSNKINVDSLLTILDSLDYYE